MHISSDHNSYQLIAEKRSFAIAIDSLVLGIISLLGAVLIPLLALIGPILGVKEYKQDKKASEPRKFALAGSITVHC